MNLFPRLSKKVTRKLDIQYQQKAEDFVKEYHFSLL